MNDNQKSAIPWANLLGCCAVALIWSTPAASAAPSSLIRDYVRNELRESNTLCGMDRRWYSCALAGGKGLNYLIREMGGPKMAGEPPECPKVDPYNGDLDDALVVPYRGRILAVCTYR